ncbi:MAG: aldehyde dehydrogenase family protein, partial [Acetobacteraceae bacterium]
MDLVQYDLYVDGQTRKAAGGERFESFDPYRGRPWALLGRGGPDDVEAAVAAADRAFHGAAWRDINATGRGRLLRQLGDLVAANAERLGRIETRDNGKLLAEMLGQVRYIPQWFYYYGGLADKIEGSVIPVDKPRMFTFTQHEPLGVVAMITPWNSPLLLAAWKMAPALAAGNTIVWKPSEFASVSALEFAKLVEQAGFPPGVVNVVTGFGAEVGEALVTHPKVAKIAFTGGERSGQRVYELAARGLKRVTLELGGKSPNIVFADANLDNAVKGVISGIFAATGQTCIAGSRLLVQRSIHNEFVDRVVKFAATARMGDPSDLETQVGPVTTRPQYERVLGFIESAKADGARCLLGGGPARRPECGEGWFVEPTIFGDVNPSM